MGVLAPLHRPSELATYYDLELRPLFSSGASAGDPVEKARMMPEAEAARMRAKETGEAWHRLLRLADGRLLRLRVQRLNDAAGQPAGFVEFIHDVSKIQAASVATPEKVSRRLLDGFGEAVCLLDAVGRIIDINDAAQDRYGIPREAMIGLHPRDLADPAHFDEKTFAGMIADVFEGCHRRLEFWGLRRDGTAFPQELTLGPGVHCGQPVIVSYAREISHRKHVERALSESEERFRTLLQYVPTLTAYGYRSDGTIHYWNRASETLYGFSADEAIGRNFLDLIVPPVDRFAAETRLAEFLRTRTAAPPSETVYMRKNGARISVFSTSLLVRLPGRDPEIYHIDIDLTEQKRAEEALVHAKELAESSSRTKGTFLATMSHEIRTPLHAVIGMSSQLILSELSEAQREMAQTIVDSGEALLSLISDILDYSRIESGKLKIARAPFSLRDIIGESFGEIASQAASKGIEVSCLLDPHAPAVLVGDAPRLRQILLNILSNAVKFTDHGKISLTVEAVCQAEHEWCIHFAITDTGIGIPKGFQARLFEPFVQADAYATRQYGGSGLGLAITRKLVEEMGGIITVLSEEGEGATFNFFIRAQADPAAGTIDSSEAVDARLGKPAAMLAGNRDIDSAANVDVKAPPPDIPEDTCVVPRSLKILIVEDNKVNQRVTRIIVSKLGHDSAIAENGRQALEAMDKVKYDLVLLDRQMPVMDGIETAREILRRQPDRFERPKLIALTADTMPEDRELFLSAGVDHYLSKPLRPDDLRRAIHRVTNG